MDKLIPSLMTYLKEKFEEEAKATSNFLSIVDYTTFIDWAEKHLEENPVSTLRPSLPGGGIQLANGQIVMLSKAAKAMPSTMDNPDKQQDTRATQVF